MFVREVCAILADEHSSSLRYIYFFNWNQYKLETENGGDMENTQHRHDMTDKVWEKLEPIMKKWTWGGSNANDDRVFLNGVFWILRTGAPWRDLPPAYGKFGSVHKRYKRWCDSGRWDYILEQVIEEPDFEWLMIDASHSKVHPHAAGAIGGNQDMERTKGG